MKTCRFGVVLLGTGVPQLGPQSAWVVSPTGGATGLGVNVQRAYPLTLQWYHTKS